MKEYGLVNNPNKNYSIVLNSIFDESIEEQLQHKLKMYKEYIDNKDKNITNE